jgi:hypothetical protein
MQKIVLLSVVLTLTVGCASTRNVGMIAKSTADPGAVVTTARPYKSLGPASAQACRYFLLGIIPWGDSTVATAVDKALDRTGGDALINASVTTGLYGFVPIYNIFCFTCTSVEGVAIEFANPQAAQ